MAVTEPRTSARATGPRAVGRLRQLLFFVFLADLWVLAVAVIVAWALRVTVDVWSAPVDPGQSLSTSAGPWIVAAWMLMLAAQGAYSVRTFGAGAEEFRAVAMASLIAAGLVGMFCYLFKIELSRGFVLLVFLLGAPMLLLERYGARKLLHSARVRGRMLHRVVAVGGVTGITEVADVLRRERYVGYKIVGACLPVGVPGDGLDVPVLGHTPDIRTICEREGTDTVLVARGGYDTSEELRRIAWRLEGSPIELIVVPSLTDIAGPRISMRPVAGLPLLHVEQPQSGEAGGLPKRVFDLVVSAGLLVLLSPVLLVVAAAVKLSDGGPVLFHQARVGREGARFGMLKFRSMVIGAEEQLPDLHGRNETDGVLFKIREDPRVTRLGRFLRRYSIDEIPQLLNVLRGEMSLVGPRPPLPTEVDQYGDDVRRRLLVRPGVTGLWQVSGRSELSWKESVRLDLYYVDNWSMVTDLVILVKTVRAVLRSAGAY